MKNNMVTVVQTFDDQYVYYVAISLATGREVARGEDDYYNSEQYKSAEDFVKAMCPRYVLINTITL